MEEKEEKKNGKKHNWCWHSLKWWISLWCIVAPPTPKKSRTSNKPRRPINKATTNIHPMRHLNIILKLGFERGTFFFFKHFLPKWPGLWAKVHFRPACLVSLLGKDWSLSHFRMVMVSYWSHQWATSGPSMPGLGQGCGPASYCAPDKKETFIFFLSASHGWVLCVCVCNAFESWAIQLTVHSSFIINNGAMPMPDQKKKKK